MQITQWHKGTDKPVRDGVYQREYSYCLFYCKFENGKWKVAAETVADAHIESDESNLQTLLRWRGITKP